MEIYLSLSYWIFQPYFWIILGLAIVIVDIFLGFILLPFGVSAFFIAILIFCDRYLIFSDFVFFETWRDILLYYAALSLIALGALRLFFNKKQTKKGDINEY